MYIRVSVHKGAQSFITNNVLRDTTKRWQMTKRNDNNSNNNVNSISRVLLDHMIPNPSSYNVFTRSQLKTMVREFGYTTNGESKSQLCAKLTDIMSTGRYGRPGTGFRSDLPEYVQDAHQRLIVTARADVVVRAGFKAVWLLQIADAIVRGRKMRRGWKVDADGLSNRQRKVLKRVARVVGGRFA